MGLDRSKNSPPQKRSALQCRSRLLDSGAVSVAADFRRIHIKKCLRRKYGYGYRGPKRPPCRTAAFIVNIAAEQSDHAICGSAYAESNDKEGKKDRKGFDFNG